jgi:hypothetical protein
MTLYTAQGPTVSIDGLCAYCAWSRSNMYGSCATVKPCTPVLQKTVYRTERTLPKVSQQENTATLSVRLALSKRSELHVMEMQQLHAHALVTRVGTPSLGRARSVANAVRAAV